MWGFLAQHYDNILAGVGGGVVTMGGSVVVKLWEERRKRGADQRMAAAEIVLPLKAYRQYWLDKRSALANEPYDESQEFQWPGDRFASFLDTKALQKTPARLPPALCETLVKLNLLAEKWRAKMGIIIEYETDDPDVMGGIAIAELAIASDDALKLVCSVARFPMPALEGDLAGIRRWLNAERRRMADEDDTRRLIAAEGAARGVHNPFDA
jgi:hypothetical protein